MQTANPKVIDLYHGDTVASFEEAFKAGIRGVIHKATEGKSLTDFAYVERREEALDAGLLWGAYHFLRPGNMRDQARRFVDHAAPTEATLLAVDHEDRGVRYDDLCAFLAEAEGEIGRPPILYSGFLIKEQLGSGSFAGLTRFRLWLAQYSQTPKWPSRVWQKPFLWQYTQRGEIAGIKGHVDLNSFDGSDEELAAQWSGAS